MLQLARAGSDTVGGGRQAAVGTQHIPTDGNLWRSTAVEIGSRTLGPRALRSWYTVPEEESEPSHLLLGTHAHVELPSVNPIPCGPFDITDADAANTSHPSQECWASFADRQRCGAERLADCRSKS